MRATAAAARGVSAGLAAEVRVVNLLSCSKFTELLTKELQQNYRVNYSSITTELQRIYCRITAMLQRNYTHITAELVQSYSKITQGRW